MKVQSKTKIFRALFWFSVCVYLLFLMRVTLFKYASLGEVLFSPDRFYSRSVNLIPFAHDGQRIARFKLELFLNFLAFCPLGFLLSMQAYGKKHGWFFLFLPLAVSLGIETLQYILWLGATDVTDILMNTAGGVFGFLAYAVLARIFRKNREKLDKVLTVCIFAVAVPALILYLAGTNWAFYKQAFLH